MKDSEVRFYGINGKESKQIGIGAVWGEMDKSAMPQRPSGGDGPDMGGGGFPGGGGGGMPPGGGGGGGGMPPGGGMGGPPGGGSSMPQKQEVWMKVIVDGLSASTETNK